MFSGSPENHPKQAVFQKHMVSVVYKKNCTVSVVHWLEEAEWHPPFFSNRQPVHKYGLSVSWTFLTQGQLVMEKQTNKQNPRDGCMPLNIKDHNRPTFPSVS